MEDDIDFAWPSRLRAPQRRFNCQQWTLEDMASASSHINGVARCTASLDQVMDVSNSYSNPRPRYEDGRIDLEKSHA